MSVYFTKTARSLRASSPSANQNSPRVWYSNPEKALEEIRRVLKDGGLLIAPNFFFREGGKKNLWQKFLSLVGVRFAHEWNEKEYKAFLESNGWKIKMDRVIEGRIDLIYVECIKN